MVTYRRAEPRDVAVLVALVGRCDAASPWLEAIPPAPQEEERLAGHLADPDHWVLAAEVDGVAVGFTSVRPGRGPGRGHVSNLFVDPALWGQGIGRELLARAIQEIGARGYEVGELNTHAANTRAKTMYERAGWHATGERFVNDEGDQMVRYELPL